MRKKKVRYITQAEAARVAGVSRSAIGNIKKDLTYNFFVQDGDKVKVDVQSKEWKTYLIERESSGSDRANKKDIDKKILKPYGVQGNKKAKDKQTIRVTAASKQKNALTGGFDPDTYIPIGISDIKRLTEIVKLKLEIMMRLGDVVDREIEGPIIDSISQTIQAYFVDLPRKVSGKIARKLDRVGMEKEIEKILVEPVARGIREVKRVCGKAAKVKKLR